MFPRIRDIIDPFGIRLRISAEATRSGVVIALERPDRASSPRVVLNAYAAEILSGYIMAARLALPTNLPPEKFNGPYGCDLRLVHEPSIAIEVHQKPASLPLEIAATLWDKLYAELCLTIPHARELRVPAGASVH